MNNSDYELFNGEVSTFNPILVRYAEGGESERGQALGNWKC
jgi:hypothetical protein